MSRLDRRFARCALLSAAAAVSLPTQAADSAPFTIDSIVPVQSTGFAYTYDPQLAASSSGAFVAVWSTGLNPCRWSS
jgi:hypothetical protein